LHSDDEDDLKIIADEEQKEKETKEEFEAKIGQHYDPENKVFNYGRREKLILGKTRVPKPVNAENEAGIAVGGKSFKKVVENFMREECNKKTEQKPNLTDNSSKLSVTDLESTSVTDSSSSGHLHRDGQETYQE
jgi:hypothetical protein